MGAKYDQLDLDERIEICRLYEAGTSRCEIGRIIGRSASTVGRELHRNRLPRGGYKPASADRIAFSRRRRLSRIERVSPLRSYVCDRLAMGWSPEQIASATMSAVSLFRDQFSAICMARWQTRTTAPDTPTLA